MLVESVKRTIPAPSGGGDGAFHAIFLGRRLRRPYLLPASAPIGQICGNHQRVKTPLITT